MNNVQQTYMRLSHQHRMNPTFFARWLISVVKVFVWCKIGEFFEGPGEMALVGIAMLKRQVGEFIKIPAIKLLKCRIELGYPPVNTGCYANMLLKHPLKGSFRSMQFFLQGH